MALILLVVFLSIAVWRVIATRKARTRSGGRQLPEGSSAVGCMMWAVAGLLATAAEFTTLSIGVFVAPLAIIVVWVAAWLAPDMRAVFGAVTGAGLFAVFIAIAGAPRGAERGVWSVAGATAVALGIVGCLLLRRRRPHSPVA